MDKLEKMLAEYAKAFTENGVEINLSMEQLIDKLSEPDVIKYVVKQKKEELSCLNQRNRRERYFPFAGH